MDLGQDFEAAEVAYGYEIEVAVIEDGFGAYLHASTKEPSVAHGREQEGHMARLAIINRYGHLGVVIGQERTDHGRQERDPAAQPLGALIGSPGHNAGKAHRGHVQKMARSCFAVMGHVPDPSHVHFARLALAHVLCRGEELVFDAEAAAKVTPGSAWNDAHFGFASGRDQAVGHLGNGSVTA